MSRTTLSLRDERRGGDLADTVHPSNPHKPKVTLLIHGYQNTEEVAQGSYRRFLGHADLDALPLATGEICEVYWPGDTNWPGHRKGHRLRNALTSTLSVLSYSIKVPVAKKAGVLLKEYFAGVARDGPVEVSLICHSLGNRVGLEFIAACVNDPASGVHVSRACLMAAAVPIEAVIGSGALYGAVNAFSQRVVLYSACDEALGPVFEMGQAFALEYTSGAVGLHGYPLAGLWSNRIDMYPHGHGDYWAEPQSAWEARAVFGGTPVTYIRSRGQLARRLPDWVGVPHRRMPGRLLFGEED